MFNNRNMKISIPETNGESIIIMLNKLLDIKDSRHLKRGYMQMTIKPLKVKYGPETTSILKNKKPTEIGTSTTRRWFNHSLRKQLIHLLVNNGMMSCSHFHIKLSDIMEQGRMGPKLKMVTLNYIKHKPARCNASSLIQKMGKHTNLKKER